MTRRNYGQACSVASALDRIGERWSVLIMRELMLGPLRFSSLAKGVGGAPTDVLTRRLRDLEADGIVRRVELQPPASGVVYELTDLGRDFESTLTELGRWGLNFYRLDDVAGVGSSWLVGALRVILQPPAAASLVLQLRSEGDSFWLRIDDGVLTASRGVTEEPDLTLSGTPPDVLGALVMGREAEGSIEIDGDRDALERLRAMVVLPPHLRAEAEAAMAEVTSPA